MGSTTTTAHPLVGRRIGRLLVVEFAGFQRSAHSRRKGNSRYLCRCSCGRETVVYASNLLGKRTQSCGCLYVESRPKAPRVFRHRRPRTKADAGAA
jgi:hypothetical protein